MLPGSSCQDTRQIVVTLVRGVLRSGHLSDRERLACYALAYTRSFLKSAAGHWRFGFDDDTAEVADEAAHTSIAELLHLTRRGDDGQPSAPLLERGMRSFLRSTDDPISDESLLLGFHQLLRAHAWQCLQRMWREEHPALARLLRRLKGRLRTAAGLRVVRDARGQFVRTRASDFRRPPIPREVLEQHLRDARLLLDLDGLEALMGDLLSAGPAHGGYCYMMDLVHVIHAGRERLLLEAAEYGLAAACGGVPREVKRERWLGQIKHRMHRIAARQVEKAQRRAQRRGLTDVFEGAELAGIRVEAAAEMVARKLGLGRPEWDGLSQRGLLLRLLPPQTPPQSLRRMQVQTDYLVRCVMSELRARIGSGGSGAPTMAGIARPDPGGPS